MSDYRTKTKKQTHKYIEDFLTRDRFLLARACIDRLEELAHDDNAKLAEASIWAILRTHHAHSIPHRDLLQKLLRRLQSRGDHKHSIAKKAMTLVESSRWRLTAVELQHALSTNFMKPLEEDRPDIDDILLACAGLLETDFWYYNISLCHHIAREFLQEYLGNDRTTGKEDMAALCFDCVSSEAFNSGPCSTENEYRERLRSYPFYRFAASNWGHYAREGLLITSTVVDFLSVESAVQSAGQALMMSLLPMRHAPKSISGLHLAAYFGLEKAAIFLLQSSTPDLRDSHYRTPLMYALEQGHLPLSRQLIGCGSDANARDIHGRTPLHLAAMHGYSDMVDLLVQSGADVNAIDNWRMSPLHMATEDAYSLTASELLSRGARVDVRDYMGWTPLLRATMSGRSSTVDKLLRNGALATDADGDLISVLSIAAMMGHDAIVRTLLEKGADIDIRDGQGWTPLLYAAANGHQRVVHVLLSLGADVQAKDEDGWDPLLLAILNGHELMVDQLLSHGADLKSTVTGGYSPLLIAAYHGYDSIVRLICHLSSREDIETKDAFGQTPLLVATRRGHEDVIDTLLQHEANIEAKEDKFGQTPLLMAIRLGDEDIVRILLDRGADIKATRTDGKNASQIASVLERGGEEGNPWLTV